MHTELRDGARSSLLPALLLLAAACTGATGTSPPGLGLVVLPEDPALEGLAPEELVDRGLRPNYHDFGDVPFGEDVEHVFRLRNTDPAAVTITRMTASCGCTVPSISYRTPEGEVVRGKTARGARDILTIPPGAVAELRFHMETGRIRTVNVDKIYQVTLASTSPNRAFLQLEAHIRVDRAFQATPNPIKVGRIPASAGGRGRTEVIRTGTSGASLARLDELPDGLRATIQLENRFGVDLWGIDVELLPPLEPGPLRRTLRVLAQTPDGAPWRPLDIEVHAFVVDDVDWTPQRLFLRNAAAAETPLEVAVEVYSLIEGQRFRITDGRLEGSGDDALELTWRPFVGSGNHPAERWILTLRTRPPLGDRILSGKAILSLDLADLPQIEIAYVVHPQ